ncbi:aminopeptidase [Candidatus Micrarchaeota archaeon]|nr:aminopeptidase [Candidatus Micrarchaeota archaeon]MBI5176807.1 aminopeptidase [Candidatus Micrarchaeota archaeon]
MLSKLELHKLGGQVVKSMLIGRRPNREGIARAKTHFRGAEAFFKNFNGRTMSLKELQSHGLSAKLVEKFCDPDYGPLFSKSGRKWLVRGDIGESVRLRYHPGNWPLAREIILAAARRGAHVAHTSGSSGFDRELLLATPTAALEDFTRMGKATLKTVDVTIYLENEDDPEWKKGMPRGKLSAGQAAAQKAHEILDSRGVKWLYIGWPFALTARRFGVSASWYEKMLFDSLRESFSARTRRLVAFYFNALNKGSKVRIVHNDGTDLSFSIKGRPGLKDVGCITQEELDAGDTGLNIPSGEAFIAPIEGSAEGVIKFGKILAIGHGFVENLQLHFHKGRVERYSASRNEKYFAEYLEENTPSTRMLAELGIGCNHGAKYCGYILTDEKIAGTIHLAIGNNTGSYHGRNKASGHLDMVKDMKGGVMLFDGKAVMKDGKPCWQKTAAG